MHLFEKIVGITLIACLFATLSCANESLPVPGFVQPSTWKTEESWRDKEHGGFNAVYFLLRASGNARSYDESLSEMQGRQLPQNLAEVLATGTSLGCQLRARSLTPAQLDSLLLPVIVHLEGNNLSEGCFYVLLRNGKRRVVCLDGPSGTICTLDKELFLRRWSGVVVHPYSRSFWADAVQVMIGAIGGVWLARLRYRRR